MPRIIVDAGHTDQVDPGAVANNTTEHAEVVLVGIALVNTLKSLQEFKAYTIELVPTNLTLVEKVSWINARNGSGDYTVSLHLNSAATSTATGTETFYLGGNEESKAKSLTLQQGVVQYLGLADRGVKGDTENRHGRLAIIRDVKGWSFLIELGFITNTGDLNAVRSKAANAVVAGLRNMLGVSPTPVPPVDPLATLYELEKKIDILLSQGAFLAQQQDEMVKGWKAWDLRLDAARGQLLAELEKQKSRIHPDWYAYETVSMKNLALENNTHIENYSLHNAKRVDWVRKIGIVRTAIKKFLPS